MSKTRILGISAYYHDSAAALVEDGKIIAAAQEERFTRIKADAEFPHHAIDYCLEAAGIDEHQLDYVVFYENPVVKFERLLTTYHLTAPNSWRSFLKAFPDWLTRKLWLESEIAKEIDPSENSQANIYKALRPFLADSVSTKKSGFDIVTDSLEQKNTESCPTKT